jgi:hypothetical protein
MNDLLRELFEGWKNGKEKVETKEMKEKIEAIIAFDTIKRKKKALALYLNVPVNTIRFDEDCDLFVIKEKEYVLLTEEERFLDIRDVVIADLGTFTFDYEWLSHELNVPMEELKKNAITDLVMGGIFSRDYLFEIIEKNQSIDWFVDRLQQKEWIPNYAFDEKELKQGDIYMYEM